jgi:hypothetical protein
MTSCNVTLENAFEDADGSTLFCKANILPYCLLASPSQALSIRLHRTTYPFL